MAVATILKNQKITISPQWMDKFWQHLAQCLGPPDPLSKQNSTSKKSWYPKKLHW